MSYQWQLNGTNIVGATNALLSLSSLPVTAAGSYACVISNPLGSVTNSAAPVRVTRLPLQFDVAGSLCSNTNGLQMRVLNLAGAGQVMIESSSDLLIWSPVYIGPPRIGALDFTDTTAPSGAMQFYRASEGGLFQGGSLRFENPHWDGINGLTFRVQGLTGHGSILVLASTNLADWIPVLTNPPALGGVTITNPPIIEGSRVYYRAVEE